MNRVFEKVGQTSVHERVKMRHGVSTVCRALSTLSTSINPLPSGPRAESELSLPFPPTDALEGSRRRR